jgi:hypothetical protein
MYSYYVGIAVIRRVKSFAVLTILIIMVEWYLILVYKMISHCLAPIRRDWGIIHNGIIDVKEAMKMELVSKEDVVQDKLGENLLYSIGKVNEKDARKIKNEISGWI